MMKARHLRLVADNSSPQSVDELFAAYRAAHARWCRDRTEAAAIAARDAYRAWAIAFLGDAAAAKAITPSHLWGYAP